MRFRPARKVLCGLSLLVFLVTTVILLRAPDLLPSSTTFASHSPSASALKAKPIHVGPYIVPAKPAKEEYPIHLLPGDLLSIQPQEQKKTSVSEGNHHHISSKGKDLSRASVLGQGQTIDHAERLPKDADGHHDAPMMAQGVRSSAVPSIVQRSRDVQMVEPGNFLQYGQIPTQAKKELSQTQAKWKEEDWNGLRNLLKQENVKPTPGNVQHAHCDPRQHIFFGKVHKTGSSTVANILQRYGFTRGLNFVLPRKQLHSRSYNYITLPGEQISLDRLIPPPLGQHYDILWNHVLYDSQFFHTIMPQDTVYVSILRHPLQQFQSAFEYYGHIPGGFLYKILQANVSNPLSLYLHQPHLYEWPGVYTSYIRNKQSQDLGMQDFHITNHSLRHQYIQKLGSDFHLVMITELFDESLVLLRRLMCWSVKDILYIPKNANVYKKNRVFTDEDLAQHRILNIADYDLYEFFLKRFTDSVNLQTQDFHQEVDYFKHLLQLVQRKCSQPNVHALKIKASEWNEPFDVRQEDCSLMQKHELLFLDDIMTDAIGRYRNSVIQMRQS